MLYWEESWRKANPQLLNLHKHSHLWLLHGLQSRVHQLGRGFDVIATHFGQGSQVLGLLLLLIDYPLEHDLPPLFQNGTHAIKLLTEGLLPSFAVVLSPPEG